MLRILVLSFLLLALPLSLAQTSPSEGFDYRLEIACPGQGFQCPVMATDELDAMGDPSLAVDPFRPTNLIIASLHGGADDDDAPSPKSRVGQVYTTFTSVDGGESWRDNPFYSPTAIRSNGRAYGEHPSITLSPYGQAFIGSLYSVPRGGDASAGFDYVIAAQKFRNLQNINTNQGGNGDYNAHFLPSIYPGNAIRQMWYTFNPVTDNMTILWTEQLTPHSSEASAGMPRFADTLDGAVDILQREAVTQRQTDALPDAVRAAMAAQDGSDRAAADAHTPRSVIGVSWTDLDPREGPKFPDREQLIGPCETSTNPVVKQGYLYVGCKVAEEDVAFRWNPATKPGDIEMFRMHPDGGEPEYLGPAPISGGAPKLGVRSDGRVALMTADIRGGDLVLDAVYGGLNEDTGAIKWGPVQKYGPDVPELPSFDVVDANIQDMIYREYSGVIHMVLKRVVERSGEPGNAAVPFEPTIHKAIVALDEKHGFLFYHDLDIGNIVHRSQDASLMQLPDEVFNDLSDDFLELPPLPHKHNGKNLGDSYQREFFAVGDYGFVIFAELVEITDLRGPGIVAPALPPPPVPAPAPAAVSSTVVAGAMSASLATAFAATKLQRKAAAGARKKR